MAPMEIETPLEAPPAVEKLTDASSTSDSLSASNTPSGAKENHALVSGSPRRSGMPPKRPLGVAKHAAATKIGNMDTKANAIRSSLGTSYSKPPARPTVSSSARRPTGNLITTTTPGSNHMPKHSTSSVDDLHKGISAVQSENKRPILPTNAKRLSITPATSARLTAQKTSLLTADMRSTVSTHLAKDKKTTTARTNAASPAKQILKPTTSNVRPTVTATPSRSSRATPNPTTTMDITASKGLKKRQSTMPASLAIGLTPAESTLSNMSVVQASRPIRPGLITRKSTMSVTIEQRLQEMELVNQMLQAAMAEDGEESDEIKEEYGKRVDETLAGLREKLEEARRAEGKPPLLGPSQNIEFGDENEASSRAGVVVDMDASGHTLGLQRVTELESALVASQEMGSHLKSELELMQVKMHDYSEAAEDVSRSPNQSTENFQNEYVARVEKLSATHANELQMLRDELAETQVSHKQAVERLTQQTEDSKVLPAGSSLEGMSTPLDEPTNTHQQALEELERKYRAEQQKALNANSRIEAFEADLSTAKEQLQDERTATSKQLEEVHAKLQATLQEKDRIISMKDKEMSEAKHELAELGHTYSRQLEEDRLNTFEKLQALEGEKEAIKARSHELEQALDSSSIQRDNIILAKENEVSSLGEVIESLQHELQQLYESKERELDDNRVKLIQEHESVVSKMEAEHRLALEKAAREKKEAEELLTMHAALHEKHENAISSLEESRKEIQKLTDAVEHEKSSSQDRTTELREALNAATSEVENLKQILEPLDRDSKDQDEKSTCSAMKFKEELDRTLQMLEEKTQENESVSSHHTAELEGLRATHAKAMETLKLSGNSECQVSLQALQAKYDELSATLENAERDHAIVLEQIKTEHHRTNQALVRSHAKEIEDIRECLRLDFTRLESDINARHAEQTASIEQDRLRDVSENQQQHEVSLFAIQQSHEKSMSELQEQVLQHRKSLADVEIQLQADRELHSSFRREIKVKHEKELDDLRMQLAKTKSGAANAEEEVESLRQQEKSLRESTIKDRQTIDELNAALIEARQKSQDNSELDKLKEQLSELKAKHASELAELRTTMKVEADKREHERKQGAEVRDRLVRELGELESYRLDLPAAKKAAEEYHKIAEVANREAQNAEDKLAHALVKAKEHETHQKELSAELEKLRAELAKGKKPKGHSRQNSAHNQELEALQTIADKEREQNDKLKKQLVDITAIAESHATRVREVEAALKVTSAELTEMQTKRLEFASSPAPKGGLRTSRWASDMLDSEAEEERGAAIEGAMAGMQEQLRQLEDVNEDMIDESQRMVNMLARATSRKTNLTA